MAAISALMINDNVLQKEKHDDDCTPTTPKQVVRVRSPRPSDVITITNSESQPGDVHKSDATAIFETNSSSDKSATSSQKSDQKRKGSDVMEVDNSDEGQDGSDGEEGDEGSAARKKKGQRFFCTGYSPCNLSFTRSEHLARHIRKHTGERPFQCHCNRRFSRLDNLRQHAQTVHVNEEIPTDSLAATGTRYQRQIRTDRVRPAARPRTGTMSSTGSQQGRGHSRNLSTSSIGSTSSVFSNAPDARRQPPPLLMAGDRPSTPPTYSSYAAQSPADMTTPTSATFPATPGSPNFASTLGSPVSTISRKAGFGGGTTPARRLSVPSSVNPYQPQYSSLYGSSYGPGPSVPSTGSPSIITSPASSTFSHTSNMHTVPTDDWRRRTWHPSTYSNLNINYNARPATSGLTYSQTPDAPQPAYAHNAMTAAGQAPRLPGIESFDHVQQRPTTPPRGGPSPTKMQPPSLLAAPNIDGPRRGHASHASWDGSRPSQYPDLDDAGRPTSSWGQRTIEQIDRTRMNIPHYQSTVPMGPPSHSAHAQHHQQMAKEALDIESSASKRVKHTGYYSTAGNTHRTSPDSSSSDGIPTPGTSAAEISPAIINSNGYIEPQLLAGDTQHTPCLAPPMSVSYPSTGYYNSISRPSAPYAHNRRGSELDRLEALVAVATSETRRR